MEHEAVGEEVALTTVGREQQKRQERRPATESFVNKKANPFFLRAKSRYFAIGKQ